MKYLKFTLFALIYFTSLQTTLAQNSMRLRGLSEDTTEKSIKFLDYPPYWYYRLSAIKPLYEVSLKKGSEANIQFTIDHPEELMIATLGRNIKIYVTPGDSLNFVLKTINKQTSILFSGKNSSQYNYPTLSDEYVMAKLGLQFPPNYSKEDGIGTYRSTVENWYYNRSEFFSKYIRENTVSPSFIDYYRDEIKYEYIQMIYSPLHNGSVAKNDLPVGYLTKADQLAESANGLSHISRTILSALTFKYIFCATDNMWNSFDTIYSNINHNFNSVVNPYLLTNMIVIYSKKQLPDYRNSLLNAVNHAEHTFKDTIATNYIKESELSYLILDKPIPEDILNNTFFRPTDHNQPISLKQLLESYSDKPLYIDFWASWCEACRVDIASSEEAKNYLKGKGLTYLYISIDKKSDISRWINASKNDHTLQDQYLLMDGINSPLAEFLKLRTIPRYLILNSDHQLKNFDAPRPTINQISDLRMSVSSAINKVIRYN